MPKYYKLPARAAAAAYADDVDAANARAAVYKALRALGWTIKGKSDA